MERDTCRCASKIRVSVSPPLVKRGAIGAGFPESAATPYTKSKSVTEKFSPQGTASPKVCILLCTYNGECFLREQIESFLAQTHENWELWASDDGSRDDTPAILEEYRGKKAITVVGGPQKGFAANYLSLTRRADTDAAYFAWSDQDDVWFPDKLSRAVSWFSKIPESEPALYCARTEIVNRDRGRLGFSSVPTRETNFSNALAQSVAGGNTMVFNRAARRLMLEGGQPDVVAHDWWVYLLVTGAGGTVHFDQQPVLLYRQHDKNALGENVSITATFLRGMWLLKGVYRHRNTLNIAALQSRRHLLTSENAAVLDLFTRARNTKNPFKRFWLLCRTGVFRHSRLHTFVFRIASIFGVYP